MNYTINYHPASVPRQTVNANNLPCASGQGQRTILVSPPLQSCQPSNGNINNNNSQGVPIVMQVGSSNPPVFYTYHGSEAVVNQAIQPNQPEMSNGIGQVVYSSLSPNHSGIKILDHNACSPNLAGVNIQGNDNKSTAARSLGEIFHVQSLPGMGNQHPQVIVSNQIQNRGQQSNTDLASMMSSLQAAGIQIVETLQDNSTTSSIPISVIANPKKENSPDKGAMSNFLTQIQNSGVQVIDSHVDTNMSIAVPKSSVDEGNVFGGNVAVVPITANETGEPVHTSAISDVIM